MATTVSLRAKEHDCHAHQCLQNSLGTVHENLLQLIVHEQ